MESGSGRDNSGADGKVRIWFIFFSSSTILPCIQMFDYMHTSYICRNNLKPISGFETFLGGLFGYLKTGCYPCKGHFSFISLLLFDYMILAFVLPGVVKNVVQPFSCLIQTLKNCQAQSSSNCENTLQIPGLSSKIWPDSSLSP